MQRIRDDDARLYDRARALLDVVSDGRYEGQPLKDMRSYGDLTDCRKIYLGLPGMRPTHRIVYQKSPTSATVEVIDVVAVEARADGYAYLLAATRLGRLPDETKARAARVHQKMIAERSDRRKTTKPR